jgi:TetR/AcrR family transcriptional regulator, transcriptional repressor for nem operon
MATSMRARAKEKTRDALLDTGFALAETTGLDGMSVNAITEAAGVAKGTFFHHFGDRTSYLVALHRRFHDRILEDMQHAVAGLPSGYDRLAAMSLTYLDACLRNRGVRALILEARGLLPIQAEITRRNDAVVAALTSDFVALGWPSPGTAARLWIAANTECALIELDLGRADPQARSAVLDFATPPARREDT